MFADWLIGTSELVAHLNVWGKGKHGSLLSRFKIYTYCLAEVILKPPTKAKTFTTTLCALFLGVSLKSHWLCVRLTNSLSSVTANWQRNLFRYLENLRTGSTVWADTVNCHKSRGDMLIDYQTVNITPTPCKNKACRHIHNMLMFSRNLVSHVHEN